MQPACLSSPLHRLLVETCSPHSHRIELRSQQPRQVLCRLTAALPDADPAAIAKAALEIFAKEPFGFALKPVVKRVLQTIASSADPAEEVRSQHASECLLYAQHTTAAVLMHVYGS